MDSTVLIRRTGASRRVAALFLLLAGAALSVLLLRPVCEATFEHALVAQHSSVACCESVADGTELDVADLAAPGPGGKLLAGGITYRVGRALVPHASMTLASLALPARSYYTRTSRILR